MRKDLLVAAVAGAAAAMVACAQETEKTSLESADPVPHEGDHPADAGVDAPSPPDSPAIRVVATVMRAACDSYEMNYRALAFDAAGAPIADPVCAWTFDDGATSDACNGSHDFGAAGVWGGTVAVTDPATGASTVTEASKDRVFDPVVVDVAVSAPACGLSFDYAISITGGSLGKNVFTTISPAELVVDHDIQAREETVTVLSAGTYTLGIIVEDETATFLCGTNATAQVVVRRCCPDHGPVDEPHEHL